MNRLPITCLALLITAFLIPPAWGAEFLLVPVGASGAHVIDGQTITLTGGGQTVVVNIQVDDWARWSGTVGYEILTSLGRRYAKVYSS